MNKNNQYASLRTFSWSSKEEVTESEQFVGYTVKKWYACKHPKTSKEEIEFINSIQMKECPRCSSKTVVKNGHRKDGIQRYRCQECKYRFTPLTNTIFESRKIPISEWIEYLLHLIEYHSVNSTAFDNRNSRTTGIYWLTKIFEVLKDVQKEVVLKGTVYIDETYLSKAKKDTVHKNGKKLRGISRNKIGIGVGYDGNQSIYIVTGTSKPSFTSTMNTYGSHIEKGSTIIHDEEKSHHILVEKLELKSIVYPTSQTKGLSDEENPLNEINRIHYLLKRFMREHSGYNRDNLQDWMNLFWFITNEPKDKYDKVLYFIQLAILSPKKMTYRDVMSKKHD